MNDDEVCQPCAAAQAQADADSYGTIRPCLGPEYCGKSRRLARTQRLAEVRAKAAAEKALEQQEGRGPTLADGMDEALRGAISNLRGGAAPGDVLELLDATYAIWTRVHAGYNVLSAARDAIVRIADEVRGD